MHDDVSQNDAGQPHTGRQNARPRADVRRVWNEIGPVYVRRQAPDHSAVSYGPWAPSEQELNLLGDVRGLKVLDLGCGGGHNCVALAQQGAQVTGVDISDVLLDDARALATRFGVDVAFRHGDITAPVTWATSIETGDWDVVLSVATLHYVAHIDAVLARCAMWLKTGGRLVVSIDHPLRNCFFDGEEEELAVMPVRAYHDDGPMRWRFPETGVCVRTYHRPVGTWVNGVAAAGLAVVELHEPAAPRATLDATWPEDGPLAPLRHVPQVLIVVAAKPAT